MNDDKEEKEEVEEVDDRLTEKVPYRMSDDERKRWMDSFEKLLVDRKQLWQRLASL